MHDVANKTHLTSKDVDGINSSEELQALMAKTRISELCSNAQRILARKGIEVNCEPAPA